MKLRVSDEVMLKSHLPGIIASQAKVSYQEGVKTKRKQSEPGIKSLLYYHIL